MGDRNIVVERLTYEPVSKNRTELVERKGIGHPDSIADGIAESFSRRLSQMYIESCEGQILHHNVDQNEVSGGQSLPCFGGGEILEPPYLLMLGRAIDEVVYENGRRVRFPVRHMAIQAARDYLRENFYDAELAREGVDIADSIILDCRVGKGSQDLVKVFEKAAEVCEVDHKTSSCRPSNDTSFGVGFAPLTETESLTLGIERYINGDMKTKDGIKASGKDVKVMAARDGNKITLTVACAMISSRLASAAEYRSTLDAMRSLIVEKARDFTGHQVELILNHADDPTAEDESGYYLTVSGLSVENGDDGSVGRGNRVNGLITPYRPMSMEAAAGKNPVTHVGKLYNILANRIAQQIVDEAGLEVSEARVRMLSQIGSPIDYPALASVELCVEDPSQFDKWKKRALEIADMQLEDIESLTQQIVYGHIAVF
jgi:S-adenosylmethionine synthetase